MVLEGKLAPAPVFPDTALAYGTDVFIKARPVPQLHHVFPLHTFDRTYQTIESLLALARTAALCWVRRLFLVWLVERSSWLYGWRQRRRGLGGGQWQASLQSGRRVK